jgi:hypothetical protein
MSCSCVDGNASLKCEEQCSGSSAIGPVGINMQCRGGDGDDYILKSSIGLTRTTLPLCACAGGATHVIAKNGCSVLTPEFPGFHGLHWESASASARKGQANKEQSDMQFASAHDSAALVQEGNIMKRVD